MAKVVLDTNVLVSALWKHPSNASRLVDMIVSGQIIPCYNAEILIEYKGVLSRPKFKFPASDISNLLNLIKIEGIAILPQQSAIPFADESDRIFYDAAKTCDAYLITGNRKHFPDEPFIMSPSEFLENKLLAFMLTQTL